MGEKITEVRTGRAASGGAAPLMLVLHYNEIEMLLYLHSEFDGAIVPNERPSGVVAGLGLAEALRD